MLLEFIGKDIKRSFHGYTYTRIKFKEALSGKGYFKTDVVKKFRNYKNWKQIIETAVKGSWISVPNEAVKGETINADFKPAIVELRNPAIEQKPKQLNLLKNGG